ncbi:FitA-like ribbon-helix-helix domain-containing protein [Allosphingosinicella humi]
MGQILVRQLDDAAIERLKIRARERKTSVEALAREAIYKAAEMTADEKRGLVRKMLDAGERAKVRGVSQTPGWMLIREDRDA